MNSETQTPPAPKTRTPRRAAQPATVPPIPRVESFADMDGSLHTSLAAAAKADLLQIITPLSGIGEDKVVLDRIVKSADLFQARLKDLLKAAPAATEKAARKPRTPKVPPPQPPQNGGEAKSPAQTSLI